MIHAISVFSVKCTVEFTSCVGIGGLLSWNSSYVLHTMFVPSSCGLYCAYKLLYLVSWPIFVRFLYETDQISCVLNIGLFFCAAIGCGNDEDILSVGNYDHKFVSETRLTGLKDVCWLDDLIDP